MKERHEVPLERTSTGSFVLDPDKTVEEEAPDSDSILSDGAFKKVRCRTVHHRSGSQN